MGADSTTTNRARGDKRARTRARLMDAALELTREKGFDAPTLQEIAARAGVTTGAIYGNFGSREALFMALAERQWAPIRPKVRAGASFAETMDALAEAVIESLAERRPAAAGALTFRAYALRHEAVRTDFRDRMAQGYAAGAAWMAASFDPDELPMPPPALARVINAMIEGLTFQAFLTPELVGEAEIRAAFAALARRDGPLKR